MSVNESLAQTSNYLVYGAMAAYALAFIAFAVCFAAAKGRELPAAAATPDGSDAVLAGSVATLTRSKSGAVTQQTASRAAEGDGSLPPLPPGRRAGNIGMSLTWLGALLLAAGVLARGLAVMRPPWGNMYEFSTASALAISVAFLVFSLRRDLRWLGVFVIAPVLLTLGLAVTVLYTAAEQLVPALNSYWLYIHVTCAIVSGGALCVGAAVTGLFLVADTSERRHRAGRSYWLEPLAVRLPEALKLDVMAYRVNAFVFPLWTFTVVAGAIWAENAWGSYWSWDPKETWAFITWLAYAAYLHARATAGWKGRKAAVLGLVAFACFLFNYYGVNIFFSGLHSYAGIK
ncbi:MAG TPA: c-type cytochrome biogenesis protein CcsB [Candidatus Nanopelagicales bacterium]